MASMLSSLLTGGQSWSASGRVPTTGPKMACRNRSTAPSPDSTVRFGRVPKREKAKILAAMQKVNAKSQETALTAELEDETKLMNCIIRAHEETCDYTKDKVIPLLERARTQPVFTQCSAQLACPLNPPPRQEENGNTRIVEDFSERFWPAIRGVVEFAKKIPGFNMLAHDDQVTLLKAGVFEVLLVRLACMFDHQSNAMICLNGQLLRREAIHSASNARFLLDSMFDFSERLNGLQLSDNEVGLFCAVVIIAADRPGIRNTELVQKIQKKLMDVLQKFIAVGHLENPGLFNELMKKIPDLRTLNTLHSEKLLAYKMEPHNQHQNPAEAASVAYSALMPEHWAHYTYMMTGGAPRPEDDRATSPISQHGGSTTGSEWSTTDSKDGGPERFGSPRSVGSCLSVDEAKSPIRTSSFSSTRSYDEGVCPMDLGSHPGALHEFVHLMKRPMPDHSSGDESFVVDSPVKVGYPKIRRVDSPTDSGIESGKEHGHSVTPTTSVCSSPHSSLEEKVKDVSDTEQEKHHHSTVDDMPVLKRALQAPPLINTTMLMDEAYRHHKKFRATRKETDSPSSPSGSYTRTPPPSLASSHSTLLKTLEQPPRYMTEQQLKRTDLIQNMIMRTESVHQPPTSRSDANPPTANFVYSVPPNHHQAIVPTKPGSGVVVCPPGYYIPTYNPSVTSSWPFVAGTTTVTVATPPTLQIRTPFVPGTPQAAMCPRSHRSALESRLTSSPNANCSSPLVISSPSPNHHVMDSRLAQVSVTPSHPTEAQPLNLSKKTTCVQPTVLKMQS